MSDQVLVEKPLHDGFYRVRRKDDPPNKWTTIGEIENDGKYQYLYLTRYDEALNPKDFIIDRFPILLNFRQN